MQFAELNVTTHPGTLTSDRCARSGLNDSPSPSDPSGPGPLSFTTIYTTCFDEMAAFYRQMLSPADLRIDGKGMLVFGNSGGSIVLKQVGEDSQFAKLVGRQSVGLVGFAPDLKGFANSRIGEDLEWDTTVTQVNDPDGNIILFAEPEAAEVIELHTVNS